MSEPLSGKVVAIIAHGSPFDRAIAVALAQAGADVAIATWSPERDEEFATASVANEVWAMGREQFSYVLDASCETGLAAFGAETVARLGGCDALILADSPSTAMVIGSLLPAFVRGAGRDVACLALGPAAPSSVVVLSTGRDAAVATAIADSLRP